MAEKFKTLQNKNESFPFENKFANPNVSSRSEIGAVIRKHKTPPKSLAPRTHTYGHLVGWQRKTEMESLRAIATPSKINATISKVKHNNVTGSNCSTSPVRRNDKSFSTSKENSSFRLVQPTKKFIPSLDNDSFFKELWENIVSRHPEWMQKIWRNGQQERMAKFLQEASESQTGDKTINDTRNAEESIKEVENTLTPISEEEQDSLSSSFHNASITEVFDTTDFGNENSVVDEHDEQRSLSSRMSLGRTSSEISEVFDKVIEWREWSLQLTSDGKLIITGKSDHNTLTKSRDVSTWERVDAHTLRHRRDGSVYKLVGAADHFVCQDLPSYVRTKFQYGFPEEWLQIRDMWLKYRKEGNPNFVWSADTDYNRVKPGMNATYAGSSTTYNDHIPVLPSENTKSVNIKIKSIKQDVSEKQKKTEPSNREAMKDLSNVTYKRPLHKAHSLNALSPKAANEAATLKNVNPKAESTKVTGKTLKASKKTKNEPQALRNWYPLLSEGGLKFSGFLESAQNNVKHTTRIIVKADMRSRIISCCCGERYQLIGDIEASACSAPEFIKTKFKTGIPRRWKVTVKEWIEATEQTEQNDTESDAEDQDVEEFALESLVASGNLKKSKRGRIIVPPLQHWLGERITVYGVNPVYCRSPGVSAILQTSEQQDLKSPHAKKKKYGISASSEEEVNKTINKGKKKRIILN